MMQTIFTPKLRQLYAGLMIALLLSAGLLPFVSLPSAYAANGGQLVLNMEKLGDANGYLLETVRTERRYDFTKPKGWAVKPSSKVHVVFQHSPALLPERSV